MTEDIMFDNIYIGHSVEDAKKLAKETFQVKHAIETAEKDKKSESDDDDSTSTVAFKDAPIEFIREQVTTFIELAKLDPVSAFKAKPETGAALAGALITFFGMIGMLFGLVGGAQKPVVKSSKKTDAPTADDKKEAAADSTPVAPAGSPKDTPSKSAKKRGGK